MVLKSNTYEITKVLKPTKAQGWGKIKKGDKISVSLEVTNNSAPGSVYQLYADVTIERPGFTSVFSSSMSKLDWYLSFFEMKELK